MINKILWRNWALTLFFRADFFDRLHVTRFQTWY